MQIFLERPPELEGGLELSLYPIDEQRAVVRVDGFDHRYEARAAGLAVPYPSGLRRLIATDPRVEVLLLRHASRGIDRAAIEHGVGYLDLKGRGRLIGPGFVYIAPPFLPNLGSSGADVDESVDPWIQDQPGVQPSSVPRRTHGSRVSPFAPKASRVVRALLAHPWRKWKLSQIAEECRMNPGNVHRVLGALVDLGLIERDGDLYLVDDPGSLLEAWGEQAHRGMSRERIVIPVRDNLHTEVERLLGLLDDKAVVSGELAAELYAPHLPANHALVHSVRPGGLDTERLQAESRPKSLRGPSRQIVLDVTDEGVADFAERRSGLPLVSVPQLYVDLYRDRSRAREAAEHVRRELLRY